MNPRRRTLIILTLAGIAVAGIISVTYVADFSRNNSDSLPPGCVRPTGGFLIVVDNRGYNDSIAQGAPTKSWPIITARQGQNVTIVVCNTDVQAHGFQIKHYFVRNAEKTLIPGQVLKVSFIADQTGQFDIYCDIFCSVHIYMQNGLLNVTP